MKLSAPAETGDESPVTSFVQLERYNAIRLVQIVHASLSSLSKVIRGTALLDAEVQALAGALLKQEVSDGSKVVVRETGSPPKRNLDLSRETVKYEILKMRSLFKTNHCHLLAQVPHVLEQSPGRP